MPCGECRTYQQRRPESTVLYRIVQKHLESFLLHAHEGLGPAARVCLVGILLLRFEDGSSRHIHWPSRWVRSHVDPDVARRARRASSRGLGKLGQSTLTSVAPDPPEQFGDRGAM